MHCCHTSHRLFVLVAIVATASALHADTTVPALTLQAIPPSPEHLNGSGAVSELIGIHSGYLEAGLLAADHAASLAAGCPQVHLESWAAAFRTALAADPSSPQRGAALAILAGYLSGLEEWNELCAVHLESAALEPLPSDRAWHMMLAIGAKAHSIGPGSDAEAIEGLAALVESTFAAHQGAGYPSEARRSELAWRIMGNTRFATEQCLRSRNPAEVGAQVQRISATLESAVIAVQTDCTEADRARIRSMHAHLDVPLLIAAEAAAATEDVESLDRRFDAIQTLPPADRSLDTDDVIARILARHSSVSSPHMQISAHQMLSAASQTVKGMKLRVLAVHRNLIPEDQKNLVLEAVARWLQALGADDPEFEDAQRALFDSASMLASRLDSVGALQDAASWRLIAETARGPVIVRDFE